LDHPFQRLFGDSPWVWANVTSESSFFPHDSTADCQYRIQHHVIRPHPGLFGEPQKNLISIFQSRYSSVIKNHMEDINIVENWLRCDPKRWAAGVISGIVSIWVAFALGGALAASSGLQSTFPVKLIGTIIVGPRATDYHLAQGLIAGAILVTLLGAFLGFLYAHFVYSNSLKALLPMGLVWGLFSWIFIWNLFMQSFKLIFAAQVPSNGAMPVCLAFGLGLSCIKIVDKAIRS
jgi:hypothetical protein